MLSKLLLHVHRRTSKSLCFVSFQRDDKTGAVKFNIGIQPETPLRNESEEGTPKRPDGRGCIMVVALESESNPQKFRLKFPTKYIGDAAFSALKCLQEAGS